MGKNKTSQNDSVGRAGKPAWPVGRYLKYAIGEIVLVVIGILIALSINNWNESQKDIKRARTYLASIRTDMVHDLEEVQTVMRWKNKVLCFKKVYPAFELNENFKRVIEADSTCQMTYRTMFDSGRSFRSNSNTFDAMIAEGSTNLITNKTLFSKIQRLYNFYNPATMDIYNDQRQQRSQLNYKWANLITYEPNTNVADSNDKLLIADLNVFYKSKQFYTNQLINVEKLVKELISEIDAELKK